LIDFFYIQPDDGRTLLPKHVVEFTSSKLIYHPVLSCVWRHIVYTLYLTISQFHWILMP